MRVLAFLLLMLGPALAQQTTPASPMQQALGQKLIEEINANLQLRAQLLQLQDELDKLKKVDPPKEPDEKPK